RIVTELIPDLSSRGLDECFYRSLKDGVIEVLAFRFHHYLILCVPRQSSRRFQSMQQKVTIAPLSEESGPVGLIVTIEDVTAAMDREHDEALIETFNSEDWAARRSAVADMSSFGAQESVAALLRLLKEQHRNLSVLNSALRVLTGSGIET